MFFKYFSYKGSDLSGKTESFDLPIFFEKISKNLIKKGVFENEEKTQLFISLLFIRLHNIAVSFFLRSLVSFSSNRFWCEKEDLHFCNFSEFSYKELPFDFFVFDKKDLFQVLDNLWFFNYKKNGLNCFIIPSEIFNWLPPVILSKYLYQKVEPNAFNFFESLMFNCLNIYIGVLFFLKKDFFLQGEINELALKTKTLKFDEIFCLYSIDLLSFFYYFNVVIFSPILMHNSASVQKTLIKNVSEIINKALNLDYFFLNFEELAVFSIIPELIKDRFFDEAFSSLKIRNKAFNIPISYWGFFFTEGKEEDDIMFMFGDNFFSKFAESNISTVLFDYAIVEWKKKFELN